MPTIWYDAFPPSARNALGIVPLEARAAVTNAVRLVAEEHGVPIYVVWGGRITPEQALKHRDSIYLHASSRELGAYVCAAKAPSTIVMLWPEVNVGTIEDLRTLARHEARHSAQAQRGMHNRVDRDVLEADADAYAASWTTQEDRRRDLAAMARMMGR